MGNYQGLLLQNFDTSKVTDMTTMFSYCRSIKKEDSGDKLLDELYQSTINADKILQNI